MGTRYRDLDNTIAGYHRSGVPLISYDGRVFGPAGPTDDFGAYYLIPQLAVHFKLPLRRSIDAFYLAVLATAIAFGAVGCCLALKTRIGKLWAIIEILLLAGTVFNFGDVYILLASAIIGTVPFAIYFSKVSRLSSVTLFAFASGMILSAANAIRSHSGTGVLLFWYV